MFSDIIPNVEPLNAGMAQSVEHILGKDEVISSILITSSKSVSKLKTLGYSRVFNFFLKRKF